MIIQTQRLRLRPWLESDRDDFAAMVADPEVMVDTQRPLDREESDVKFDHYAAAFQRLGYSRWALETLAGDFVGYTGVMPARENHPLGPHQEMGWRLVRAAWGEGYATEAARAALADVFQRVGLTEVLAYTAPDNIRSQAVMTRLDLRREPRLDFSSRDSGAEWTGLVWVARPA